MDRRPLNRKVVALRLTEECRRLLVLLADARGISQAAVIELLVRDEARRTNVEEEAKIAA
jgi:hypothetical protein